MAFRTSLGRALGLGSARSGTEHWWLQRLTAIALLPLTLWLLWFLDRFLSLDHAAMMDWLASPWHGGLLLAYLLAAAYHAALGLQVVIDDYLHRRALRLFALVVVKLGLGLLLLVAVVTVVKIVAWGGRP